MLHVRAGMIKSRILAVSLAVNFNFDLSLSYYIIISLHTFISLYRGNTILAAVLNVDYITSDYG